MTGEGGFSFKSWYAENGEELNETRRRRYELDPAYKARVLKLNRDSRARARKKRAEVRRREREAVATPTKPLPFKTVDVPMGEGQPPVKLFTIGALATALGCSVQLVRLWEKRGVIHPAELRSDRGDRLYTDHELEVIRERLIKNGILQLDAAGRVYQMEKPKHFVRRVRFEDGTEEDVALFRVGVLAKAINRTVLTVEQMEKRGALPSTPLRASRTRYRLYTAEMVAVVAQAYNDRDGTIRGKEQWAAFSAEVTEGWRSLGTLGASLVDP